MANKKVNQLTSKPAVNLTDLFLIADPTSGQAYKTTISDLGTAIGSGVSSVNGLVGAVVLDTDDIQELVSPTNKWFTDTRARTALSASSPLTYNSGTGVFGIQVANGSQNGYLSSADWTTFNAKQAALSGTGFVKISGTTISYDNSTYLTTSSAASTYLALAGGTLTGALNGTSATFTGDLTISSNNPRLYLTDTDNNPDYFISNTDGTFTIYDVTNSTSRLTISTLNTILNTNLRVDGDVLIKQDSVFGGVAGYTGIGSDSAGIFLKLGTATSHAYLVLSGLTSYRNFTLPDATGTIALTSDLSSYLPLSGGTLTGALNGTSVSLSSSVTASALYVTGMTAGSGAIYHTASRLTFANYNASGTLHFEVNGGTGALTINADTSATFNGQINSITGVFGTKGGGSYGVMISDNDQSNVRLRFTNTGSGGRSYSIVGGLPGANNSYFAIHDETANSTRFNISDTGAATFSSSVTAGANITISPSTGGYYVYGSIPVARYSYFGYSSGYNGVLLGNTAGQSLFFNVDITGNPSGAFSGNGSEYVWRNAGSFITPNSSNNGYNTLLSWNSSGQLNIPNNVGIGTTSPTLAKVVIEKAGAQFPGLLINNTTSDEATIRFKSTHSANSDYKIGASILIDSAFEVYSVNAAATRMAITSGGSILIGITSEDAVGGITIRPTGTTMVFNNLNTAPTVMSFQYNSSAVGSITRSTTTTSYNITSDYRLKEDLKPINGLEIVNKIKVYDYKWKASGARMDGVLAHELAEVLPYAVHGVKDGEMMQGVDYSKIVPVLIQAIKDQQVQIEQLKNK